MWEASCSHPALLFVVEKRSIRFSAQSDPLEYLQQLKAVQLKEHCKELGLKATGKKSELQDRIREHFQSVAAGQGNNIAANDDEKFESMSKQELKEIAISRSLSSSGTKEDLIARIEEDIEFTRELVRTQPSPSSGKHDNTDYVALSRVLEEAASRDITLSGYLAELQEKANVVPKYVDVTIESIGLKPEKFTAGGMPCVTADVLRTLAGDPFADPPRYGTVSTAISFCFKRIHC